MATTGRGTRILGRDELRDLSRRRPLRAAGTIAWQWAVILAAAGTAVWWGHWYGYLIALVVIATRQHALAVLMHDGAHRSLFAHRALNDLVSDLLLAFPLFVSTSLYRRHHLDHHRYLNTERDPDLDTAALAHTSQDWARLFAGDVTGVNLLKTVDTLDQFSLLPVLRGDRTVALAMGRGRRNLFVGHLLALAAVLTLTGSWISYLLLWILPSLTALSMILRLRAVAEHVGCDPDGGIGGTRTVLANPVERLLFSPCRINYHLAHHLYPSVPFYNLGLLHRRLMQNQDVRERARIARSYLFGRASVLGHLAQARRDGVPS
ncbi:fatty acid desaturase family protein [Kineosporia sp. J2-2]|uniref:Fatty acid desaturase family protein n=1 Tax=Kineosporia corallincola TaxID=2835133 RepID=A0ABS5TQG2_9ACTN|nr:fatty acid desaturase family protein [Kineosporia corallincola]MBT0773331.1 fatty acid desaturase family protein [Kineosporia corallincola]